MRDSGFEVSFLCNYFSNDEKIEDVENKASISAVRCRSTVWQQSSMAFEDAVRTRGTEVSGL